MNNKLEKYWTHINFRSDFTLAEQLTNRDGVTINPLSMDWRIVYTVPCATPRAYIASHENGVLTNATVDTETNTIYVSFDNHGLPIGELVATMEYELANPMYPDGVQKVYFPKITGIKLWDGASDCIKAEPSVFVLNYVRGPKGAEGESAYQLAQSAGYEGTEQELAQALERVPSIPEVLVINTTKLALQIAEYGRELYDKILEAKTSARPLMATPSNTVTSQRIINLQYDSKKTEALLVVEDIPKTTDNGATYAERLVFYHIASDGTITKEEYKGNVGEGVTYTPQELTDAQQEQARENIGIPVLIGIDSSRIGDSTYAKSVYDAVKKAKTEGRGYILYNTYPATNKYVIGATFTSGNELYIQFYKRAQWRTSPIPAHLVIEVTEYKITSAGAVSTTISRDIEFGRIIGSQIVPNSVPLSALNQNELNTSIEETLSLAKEYTDEEVKDKADPDGYYPKMAVGFAENLVGRGESTPEEFTFRPSAGDGRSIGDGVARITKVNGNSVVWNQKFDVSQVLTSNANGITYTQDGFVFTANGTANSTSTSHSANNVKLHALHKYMIPAKISNGFYAQVYDQNNAIAYETIFTAQYSSDAMIRLRVAAGTTLTNYKFTLYIIDLTQMFGAGNEPTTVKEFYERMPQGINPLAYNEGEIVDMNVDAIKTVGFNQFNGTYAKVIGGKTYYLGGTYTSVGFTTELGGTTEAITIPSNSLYNPTQNGYIYAQGTDICINLSHTGYKDGTYEPYETFTRNLPVIAKYFPEGMKSAGNVRDEIRWDISLQKWVAVQNVGTRDYLAEDESDTTVTTDGQHTNYELAEPIITPIDEEDINFDYEVNDFGTEEALADTPSSAISADIIYQFNATDQIRTNHLSIEELRGIITTLQNQVAELQTAQATPSEVTEGGA